VANRLEVFPLRLTLFLLQLVSLFIAEFAAAELPQSRINALEKNVSLQAETDLRRRIAAFFVDRPAAEMPGEVQISLHPEVAEIRQASDDPNEPPKSIAKLRMLRANVTLVGDVPEELGKDLAASLLRDYEKLGYRVKRDDGQDLPLFTTNVAVTLTKELAIRKWTVAAAMIGAWAALMLVLAFFGRIFFFRAKPGRRAGGQGRPQYTADGDRLNQLLGDTDLSLPDLPTMPHRLEPPIIPRETIPAISVVQQTSEPEVGIESIRPNPPKVNPNRLQNLFRSLSFEDAISELVALSPEERDEAMNYLKLNGAIRDRLRTIVNQAAAERGLR
jgi:hypothetical protein